MTSYQRILLNKKSINHKVLKAYLNLIEPEVKKLMVSQKEQLPIWNEFKENIINTGDIELDFTRKMLEREVVDVN